MASRQVARKPEAFDIDWGDAFEVLPWNEDRTEDIARFLMDTRSMSFTELSECADGTLDSARHYVTRARKYVKEELADDQVGFAASSLVYEKEGGKLVGVCLCCGWSVYHLEVHPDYQRQGLATRMLQHALTVHAGHGSPQLDLWREDDSPGAMLYGRLGFKATGAME